MNNYEGAIILWKAALLATSALMSGCSASCGSYQYLRFPLGADVRVSEVRIPALAGLTRVAPFPISYALERTRYRLKLQVDETSYLPTANISVESNDLQSLAVTMLPNDVGPDGCYSYQESRTMLKFTWLGRGHCDARRSIMLSVNDANGMRLGVERFSFDVVTNGHYCVADSI